MSATQSPGSSETVLIIIAFILLVAVRRVYRIYRGTRFSLGRTVVFALVYVLLGVAVSGASFYEGVPVYLAPLYALVAAVSAAASYRFADRRITFWRGPDGSLYFKGGVVIYLVYLVGLVGRLTIDYAVIGPSAFSFAPGLTLTGTALDGTIATDLLLILGVGLLIGRNIRTVRRYRRIERGEDKIPDSPSQLGSEIGPSPSTMNANPQSTQMACQCPESEPTDSKFALPHL